MMGSTRGGLWGWRGAGGGSSWRGAALGAQSLPWQCPPLCFLMSFILISEMRDKVCNVSSLGIPQSAAAISRFHSSLCEHEMELQYCFTNPFMINNVSAGSCSRCVGRGLLAAPARGREQCWRWGGWAGGGGAAMGWGAARAHTLPSLVHWDGCWEFPCSHGCMWPSQPAALQVGEVEPGPDGVQQQPVLQGEPLPIQVDKGQITATASRQQ